MALSGVLAGGASFGAGVADAAPAAPPPPRCVIGPTTYVQPPAPDRPLVEAFGAAKTCVDAITDDVLGTGDLTKYGLERVPTAAPATTPKPAAPLPKPASPKPTTPPVTTAPKPSPTTTTTSAAPVTTTPDTTTPTTGAQPDPTTSAPEVPKPPTAPVTSPVAADPGPSGGNGGADPTVREVPAPPAGRVAAPSVPEAGAAAAAAAPAAPVVLPPGGTDALPAIADAPLGDVPAGDVVPYDGSLLEPVADASFLDPMGVPDLGSLPGEVAPLRTLGDDVSAVTTSSRVQALGLDGLHRGGGLPAVLGVTILSGLSGFALRHRILARIRATTAGDGPDPGDPDDRDDLADVPGGRHSA